MREEFMNFQHTSCSSDGSLRRRGVMLSRMQRFVLRAHVAALALHAWMPARIALHPLSIVLVVTLIFVIWSPLVAVLALLVHIGLAIWVAQRPPSPLAPHPAHAATRQHLAALPPIIPFSPAPADGMRPRTALQIPSSPHPRHADPEQYIAVQEQAVALAAQVDAVGIEVHCIALGDTGGDWIAWVRVGAEPLLVRTVIHPAPARTAVLADSDPTLAWIVTTVLPLPASDALLSSLIDMPPAP
jgi:hypothetical protein